MDKKWISRRSPVYAMNGMVATSQVYTVDIVD